MAAARLEKSAETIRSLTGPQPFELAIVLGSGLGSLVDEVEKPAQFEYGDLPCLPPVTVQGHAGRLVAGSLAGYRTLVFQGRHHLYEGYSAAKVTTTVQLAAKLGCRRLLLTNAVGGINAAFKPGDFMFVGDHINLLGDNPLRGQRENPFLDLSSLYAVDLYPTLHRFAMEQGLTLHRGVLAALPGPSYETPAEIRMLRTLGADAVSMSTVPEAIMGKYLGLEVTALSLVTNTAAGLAEAPLDHREVLAAGRSRGEAFCRLVRALVDSWGKQVRSNQ